MTQGLRRHIGGGGGGGSGRGQEEKSGRTCKSQRRRYGVRRNEAGESKEEWIRQRKIRELKVTARKREKKKSKLR